MADDPDDLDDLDAAMAAGGIMVVDESSSICSDHEDDEEEYEELSTVRTSWLIPSQLGTGQLQNHCEHGGRWGQWQRQHGGWSKPWLWPPTRLFRLIYHLRAPRRAGA